MENVSLPYSARRSLHSVHGHATRGNRRRHVDHVDAKWDTSDMDVDDNTVGSSRRSLSKSDDTAVKSKSSMPDMSFLLPYLRTLIVELLKKLDGTSWEKVGHHTLAAIDEMIEILTKSDKPKTTD